MSKPAKVLYVHHGSGEGGAANSLLYLLQNLDRDKYEPMVACNFEYPRAQEHFSTQGFAPIDLPIAPIAHSSKTWQLDSPRGLAKFAQWLLMKQPIARRGFRQLLDCVLPDIVHLNGVSLLPLSATARKMGLPVVQHVRESVNPGRFGIRRSWLRKQALLNAAHIIYICEDGKRRFPVPTSNHSVIYNPVPVEKFSGGNQKDNRAVFSIPVDAPVLFFPGGSMLDIKGIIPFLLALARVRDRHSDVVAIIPGIDKVPHPRDKSRKDLEDVIVEHRLEEAIVRVPFSTCVEKYYCASDIVAVPFLLPHFSRAVVEAGAASRPIVGSRIGGIQEVLDDGKVGLLVTPGDAVDLANKLCILIEDHEQATLLGRAGYNIAREKFDAMHHAQAVMSVYEQVLGPIIASK